MKNKIEKVVEKVEDKKNKVTAAAPTLTESITKRLAWLEKQCVNLETEIAVLQKRKKKYTEGLPKVKKSLAELKAKKASLETRKEKELEQIRLLSTNFLGAEHGDNAES